MQILNKSTHPYVLGSEFWLSTQWKTGCGSENLVLKKKRVLNKLTMINLRSSELVFLLISATIQTERFDSVYSRQFSVHSAALPHQDIDIMQTHFHFICINGI